jgi:hypothetical protein
LRQLQNDTKRDRRSNTWNNPAKFKRKHLDRNKVDDHLLAAGADYMISGDQLTLKADFLRSHVPEALGESGADDPVLIRSVGGLTQSPPIQFFGCAVLSSAII